jgi:hypothetical protein
MDHGETDFDLRAWEEPHGNLRFESPAIGAASLSLEAERGNLHFKGASLDGVRIFGPNRATGISVEVVRLREGSGGSRVANEYQGGYAQDKNVQIGRAHV